MIKRDELTHFHIFTSKMIAFPYQIQKIEKMTAKHSVHVPHCHDFFSITFIAKAKGTHVIDFKHYNMDTNCIYFIRPGSVHYWENTIALKGYSIYFNEGLFHSYQDDEGFLRSLRFFQEGAVPELSVSNDEARTISSYINLLEEEYEANENDKIAAMQSIAKYFLINLNRLYTRYNIENKYASDSRVTKFLILLEKNFLKTRNVREYSDLLGISELHFSKTIKKHLGYSAKKIISNRVILESKRLLAHTDKTIFEISLDLNFNDPSYFVRFFKKETGITPLAFRKPFSRK